MLSDKSRGRGNNLPPAIAERLARHKAQEQLVYKRKLKHLQRIIKELVFVSTIDCIFVCTVNGMFKKKKWGGEMFHHSIYVQYSQQKS